VRTRIRLLLLAAAFAGGCGTIDPGPNFVAPDLTLDEDFFYCRIMPEVIVPQSCASGGSGEAGECHADRSALRLDPMAETDPPPTCSGDMVTGTVPASYQANLSSVRFTVQSDPTSSPLYRRPLQLDSHPRQIFLPTSPEADLIAQWISGGAQ
jgi:hypothetical protein